MSDNNVCETCGGYKTIWYKVDLVMKGGPEQTVVPSQGVLTTTPFNLCPGHPEPAPKHDGKMSDYAFVKVNEYPSVEIASKGDEEATLSYYEAVHISPKEALSLLDWLRQEEQELQRLAKEQDREQ